MKDTILLELARRWEADAKEPKDEDGADDAKIGNAIARGERQAKRECADTLRMLVSMLGDKPEECSDKIRFVRYKELWSTFWDSMSGENENA